MPAGAILAFHSSIPVKHQREAFMPANNTNRDVRMRAFTKAVLISLILCSCVGCDQVTKTAAQYHLPSSHPVYLMGDLFQFQHSTNTGAFMGLGAGLPGAVRFWALTISVGMALIGTLGFVWASREMGHPLSILGASLMVGGGASNLLDRLLHNGAVVDFVSMGVGNLRTGVFNLADVAIMAGAGILLAWNLFFRGAEGNHQR
jgi:signal peptidase II